MDGSDASTGLAFLKNGAKDNTSPMAAVIGSRFTTLKPVLLSLLSPGF